MDHARYGCVMQILTVIVCTEANSHTGKYCRLYVSPLQSSVLNRCDQLRHYYNS